MEFFSPDPATWFCIPLGSAEMARPMACLLADAPEIDVREVYALSMDGVDTAYVMGLAPTPDGAARAVAFASGFIYGWMYRDRCRAKESQP